MTEKVEKIHSIELKKNTYRYISSSNPSPGHSSGDNDPILLLDFCCSYSENLNGLSLKLYR